MRWVVAAHPDDELIFAGAAILSHPDEAWTVVIVTQTETTERAAEALCARDLLRGEGLRIDYRFLGQADFRIHSTGGIDPPVVTRRLAELGVGRGERVYTHGAPGEYGHSGHKAVHWATVEALGATADISVFSGGGQVLERIADPALLAGKARLFNRAYPSQRGVWTGLARTMFEATREESHFDLSAPGAQAAHPANPIGRLPEDPNKSALTQAVNGQIAALGSTVADALVIGLHPGVDLGALRTKVAGRIDVLDPSPGAAGPAADHPDVARISEDFLAWDPGGRRYDLVVCVGAQFVWDFDAIFQGAARLLRPAGQLILVHEPLIEGHPDNGRGYFVSDAARYRRPTQSVLDLSRRNGLKVRLLKEFVGGLRLGEPVIHQLVRLERR